MAIEFLKKAAKTPQSGEEETVRIVQEILQAIKSSGEKKVIEYINNYEQIVIVEDHSIDGGLGSIISEIITKYGIGKKIHYHGLYNEFIESDTPENLAINYKLDPKGILSIISNI